MKIIICSTKGSIRERWLSILRGPHPSIYQASSVQTLQSFVHKNEHYLFLIHQSFMDIQTIGTLCRKSDFYKVFILSDAPNKEEGLAFLQRGAVGYANSYISQARLVEAVKTVRSGRVWFGQEIVNTLIKSISVSKDGQEESETTGSGRQLSMLTERENEIALLVSKGMSNNEIGEELFISERTVKSHIGTIFNKTGTKSRLQLALLVLRHSS